MAGVAAGLEDGLDSRRVIAVVPGPVGAGEGDAAAARRRPILGGTDDSGDRWRAGGWERSFCVDLTVRGRRAEDPPGEGESADRRRRSVTRPAGDWALGGRRLRVAGASAPESGRRDRPDSGAEAPATQTGFLALGYPRSPVSRAESRGKGKRSMLLSYPTSQSGAAHLRPVGWPYYGDPGSRTAASRPLPRNPTHPDLPSPAGTSSIPREADRRGLASTSASERADYRTGRRDDHRRRRSLRPSQ